MPMISRHYFLSSKPNGPDATQVQPSHWNDGHFFFGGAAGDVLTADPADPYGAKWQTPDRYWVGVPSPPPVLALPPDFWAYSVLLQNTGAYVCHGAAPTSGAFRRGARLRIVNTSANGIVTLANYSATAAVGRFLNFSTAANATKLAPTAGVILGGTIEYEWDGGTWLVTNHAQAAPVAMTVAAVGCTPSAIVARYMLNGRDAHIFCQIQGATIPAATPTISITGLPFTFADIGSVQSVGFTNYDPFHQNWGVVPVFATGDGTGFTISYSPGWPPGAGGIFVTVDLTLAIL